jgi:uncharacterized protein YggU (UPF0235/DUF167 family)
MYIKVWAIAGAKKESLRVVNTGTLEVSVNEPASRNLANRRIIEIVAAHYATRKEDVRIISGHRSRSKMLSVG